LLFQKEILLSKVVNERVTFKKIGEGICTNGVNLTEKSGLLLIARMNIAVDVSRGQIG
jgi:hypothetical protein